MTEQKSPYRIFLRKAGDYKCCLQLPESGARQHGPISGCFIPDLRKTGIPTIPSGSMYPPQKRQTLMPSAVNNVLYNIVAAYNKQMTEQAEKEKPA
ncbi:MAG TPA: hypothetical protein H9734_07275 [Candidatus Fusicatenibacter merdavium]|uniref:Uncharacterized protein n=1 Tax=Candidatus Fusicatenibacter merdavium TaxID=2838600 RepID=A0A9D1XD63_9FIRM|nr:hypothetical protein [Candidatus Fusicatenibacter merdavium]